MNGATKKNLPSGDSELVIETPKNGGHMESFWDDPNRRPKPSGGRG